MNIGSKLNVSLILTILIKASLFGSKSVQGKFSLQPEKESQIALNNFDEEVIPVVLQPWITIFNASEGAKILETYNKKYNEFIELQKKYTKALANVSHVNFIKRQVQIENLLTSPFFLEAQEAYISKKSDFIKKFVKLVFAKDRYLEFYDLFMQPYCYYSFFELVGMQAVGMVVFDKLQQDIIKCIYDNKTSFLPVLFEMFTLDADMCCNKTDFNSNNEIVIEKNNNRY